MKFGICSEIFEEWGDFTRTCDFIADVGYDGIEIAPFNFGVHVKDIRPETRRGIVQDAATAGVEVIGLHWLLKTPEGLHITCGDAGVRERTAEYLIDLAHFCGEIGGTRMIFGSPKQRNLEEGQAYQEGFDNARGVFEKVLPTLEEHGIVLCMEPLAESETNFCQTVKQTVELIEAVDHPSFQLILDTKAMLDEPLGRPDTIKKYAPYLKHYHANDENLKGPGFGPVNFAPIFQALKEIDYDGYISVEVFDFDMGPVGIAARSFEYMQQFV